MSNNIDKIRELTDAINGETPGETVSNKVKPDSKSDIIRNSKGQFVSGSVGGPGHTPGVPNRMYTLKKAFLAAFDELGGYAKLKKWAKKSPANYRDFLKMIAKMLPVDVNVSGPDGGPIVVEDSRKQLLEKLNKLNGN